MPDQKTNHHYVAQTYLRGFLDPTLEARGQRVIWVYRMGHRPTNKGTKVVARETLFYQMPDFPPLRDDTEDTLMKLESAASQPLRTLRSGNIRLSRAEKGELAGFIGMSLSRGPFLRDVSNANAIRKALEHTEDMVKPGVLESKLAEHGITLPDDVAVESLRQVSQMILDGQIHISQESKAWNIKVMYEVSSTYVNYFEKMRWRLLEAPPNTAFITSDNPVIVKDDKRRRLGPVNFSLTEEAEFRFPISRKFLLAGDYQDEPDDKLAVSPDSVSDLNTAQVARAYREVYASYCSEDLQRQIDDVHSQRPPLVPAPANE